MRVIRVTEIKTKLDLCQAFACFVFIVAIFGIPEAHAVDPSPPDSASIEQARLQDAFKYEFRVKSFEEKVSEQKFIDDDLEVEETSLEGPFFRVGKVEIKGNQNISIEDLEPFIAPLIDQEISLQELQATAAEIKKYYRSKGYVASYVYIPPQTIRDGTAQIQVVEGRLGKIRVMGNRWFSEKVIKDHIRVKSGEVLYFKKLRRDTVSLNRHRDVHAKALLKKGAESGTTDIVINVNDKLPVHFGADVSNRGTENTGKTRVGLSAQYSNLFGRMGQATARVQLGKRIWGVGAEASMPISSRGTKAGVSFSRSSVEVGGAFKPLEIKGNATNYGFYFFQPFVLKDSLDMSYRVGFDWKSIKNFLLGSSSGRDELRVLNQEIQTSWADKWGRTRFTNSFHLGFSRFLGASAKNEAQASRSGTGGQFFVYRSGVNRVQKLPFGLSLDLRGAAQLTPDRLAPSEQFRLGGALSVRGYPEGDYLADNGARFSAEIVSPVYIIPKEWKLPFLKQTLRELLQGVLFFDLGGGSLQNQFSGEDRSKFLASFGGGVRIRLMDHVYARAEWARAIGQKAADHSKGAFHFSVISEVL